MTGYCHTHFDNVGTVISQIVNFSATRPASMPGVPDVGDYVVTREVPIDDIDALRAAWNPGTFQARQAIIDALPKIQTISIAGLIPES